MNFRELSKIPYLKMMDRKEDPNITLLVVQTVFMKVMKLFSSQDVIIWSQKEKIVNKWTNLLGH